MSPDEHGPQTPEERAVQLGPGSAAAAAHAWLTAILVDERFDQAWALTDDPLRLARAQAWVLANQGFTGVSSRDRDEVAGALESMSCDDDLWQDFAATELFAFHRAYEPDAAERRFPHLTVMSSQPRLLGPGLELVLILTHDSAAAIADLAPPDWDAWFALGLVEIPTYAAITMRHTQHGWVVAAHNPSLPVPGWPPRL